MITNQKCESCAFQTKCVAKNKLKPFSDEARVDLGVELEFISCNDYKNMDEDETDETEN
jgi:hypothetical protein